MIGSAARSVEQIATPDIERRDLGDGVFVLRSRMPLESYPDTLCHHLEHWASEAPERIFLAERDSSGGWWRLSYLEFRNRARAIAGAFLARGLSGENPVMLLSDNSIDNALVQYACMYAGIPAAPVSPAYSLISRDHSKLRFIFDLIRPPLVFAENGTLFAGALAALDLDGVELVVSRDAPHGAKATLLSELFESDAGDDVDDAFASIGPDTTAKILFTSGSTGFPKGVINTHRMMCSNQQAIAQMWPFLEKRPPVIVDWLPWHHTFGGNHNFNMVLRNGGTLYVDTGKPAPGLIERTLDNLREVGPTVYFNVPRGYDMILPHLENDAKLRERFFSNLEVLFYAAAALPQATWQRLEALARDSSAGGVTMTTAWGSTETSPLATSAHFPLERAGNIGVPAPGTEIKFVPNGDKLELRVRGVNVTPGYFRADDLTASAYDEDGFYRIEDAGQLSNADDPNSGILFDGRVTEDFKLGTGSWVSVGTLRVAAVGACDPAIQDAVVAGHDRDEVGLLVFPNPAGCAALAGHDAGTPLSDLVVHRDVQKHIRERLETYNGDHGAATTRIARVLLMTEPPSLDADEITDKGYINQRAVLDRRAKLVERLFAGTGEDVIVLSG